MGYRVSHGSLLVRSPKRDGAGNVDLVFVGVEYVSVPRHLRGVTVEEGGAKDIAGAAAAISKNEAKEERVFVLVSEGQRHLVVAAHCSVSEHDRDIFDSPFE